MPRRSAILYFVFVAASWLTALAGNELLLFLWPHLAGLALQDLGFSSSWGPFALQGLGAFVVLAAARLLERVAGAGSDSWLAAGLLVAGSLATATILFFGFALAMGWSTGV